MGFLLNNSDDTYVPVSPASTNNTGPLFSVNDPQCLQNETFTNGTGHHSIGPPASKEATIALSILYSCITTVGLIGNFLVIYVILKDRKMRRSVTNLFIMNLAVADFLIMFFGIPDIVQFAIGRGWLLGEAMCKFQRYVMVFSVYVSIMSLVAVCVERYIAIVHPIKAHIFCSRRRILVSISIIWPVALCCALPTALFNHVQRPGPNFPVELCTLLFPSDHETYHMVYKMAEFLAFFLGPVLVQIVLYSIISKHLFMGTEDLHRKQIREQDGLQKEKDSDAIKARKGVVKMLIATVLVYFISYAPVQIPLFHNLVAHEPFKRNLPFLVLVMTLAFINSAANPIIYSVFSQNFRRKFAHVLCRCKEETQRMRYPGRNTSTVTESMNTRSTVRFTSLRAGTSTSIVSEM